MSMYGANPEQLAHLGRSLRQQIEVVEQVQRTVTQALGGTTWMGPARDRFEHDWNTSLSASLISAEANQRKGVVEVRNIR